MFTFNFNIYVLPSAYLLDLIFADPLWFPHPVRLFGSAIYFFEKKLNNGSYKFIKGAFLTLFLSAFVFIFFHFLIRFAPWLNIIFVFAGIANKGLINESKKVVLKLKNEGLDAGRKQLSYIVGRNTENLTENEVKIAVLETMSENLSDGVVAPLFFFVLAGVPGMMTYKMINTLDSILGHNNEKFLLFGKTAAKLDDFFNFVPARITAFFIAAVSLNIRSLKFILKFGKAHVSPNSGYPEAALAGVLNCRFGGNHYYDEKIIKKPYIGEKYRSINDSDFKIAYFINHSVCLVSVLIITFFKCIK